MPLEQSKSYCAILLSIFIVVLSPSAGELRFASENMFISIAPPDTLCVQGEYFFASKSGEPLSTPVAYPFPVDSLHAFPHVIRVEQKGKLLPFEPQVRSATIVFPLKLDKNETSCVTISYRQKLSRPKARYIITTTQTWGEPLAWGYYRIAMPSGAALSYLSYPSDSVFSRADSTIYEFRKKNFMPERDIVVEFTVKNRSAEWLPPVTGAGQR
jgi:hypothetical protein